MKNIYILILFVSVSFCGCNKIDLLLDKSPRSDIRYVETVEDCELILNSFIGVANTHLLDDDFDLTNMSAISSLTRGSTNYNIYTFWPGNYIYTYGVNDPVYSLLYKNIYYMNVIISTIDDVEGDDPTLRNQVKGEAFFRRAYYHYTLLKLYSKQYNPQTATEDLGIPLAVEINPRATLSRSSVEETYNSILSDLDVAEKSISTKTPADFYKHRVSKLAVYSFKTKIHLDKQQWSDAVVSGEEALKNDHSLLDYTSYTSYSEISDDISIFVHRDISFLMGVSSSTAGYYSTTASYKYTLTNDVKNLIDTTNDMRYRIFMETVNETIRFQHTAYKIYSLNTTGAPLVFINQGTSVAGLYLDLMEAYMRSGNSSNALTLYNTFAKTRYKNFSDVSSLSIDDIKKERRIEFLANGSRFFDIKRYQVLGEMTEDIVRTDDSGAEIGRLAKDNANRFAMPIAKFIININPNIKQNPY